MLLGVAVEHCVVHNEFMDIACVIFVVVNIPDLEPGMPREADISCAIHSRNPLAVAVAVEPRMKLADAGLFAVGQGVSQSSIELL